ncbi:MAG: hypothetical protein NTV33_04075 [Coprothermobacterota bacterium]|nr:hypothetical protein [Coprothermobacterota bacterium]
MKKGRVIYFIVLLVLCALFLVSYQQISLASSTVLNGDQQETLVDVVRVGSNFLAHSAWGALDKWKGAALSEPFPLYDLDNHLSAYGFNVMDLNGPCGYIIVNTDKDDAPIPEFGDGPGLPFLEKYREISTKAGTALLPDQGLGASRVIYLSATTFLAEFPIYQKDSSGCLIFDLQTGEVLTALPSKAVSTDVPSSGTNQKAWAFLEKASSSATPDSIFLERIISGVPAYLWFRGLYDHGP